jgi:hypothetical protein
MVKGGWMARVTNLLVRPALGQGCTKLQQLRGTRITPLPATMQGNAARAPPRVLEPPPAPLTFWIERLGCVQV